jgi:hypothetical protein
MMIFPSIIGFTHSRSSQSKKKMEANRNRFASDGFEDCSMKIVLGQIRNVFCQARFMPGGRITVNKPFVDCLIDQGDRRIQKLAALGFFSCGQCMTEFFDLRAQFTPVASVDFVTLYVLSYALFC